MAAPTEAQLKTLTIADFTTEYFFKPSLLEPMFRKRKTVADVERDAAKLKAVSAAGRRWIVDERCSWLSIGRHAGKLRFR